jgi:DNA polymerase sigma
LYRFEDMFCDQATEPPEYVLKARASTIRHVQYVIRAKYGAKYRVEAFGSTEYGVSTASSDLDLVIIVSHLSCRIAHPEIHIILLQRILPG